MNHSPEHKALMAQFGPISQAWLEARDKIGPNPVERKFDSIMGLTPEDYETLRVVSGQAQALILRYKQLHGSLYDIGLSLWEHDINFVHVAGIALMCDTPALGEVIEYLYHDLGSQDLNDVRDEYRDRCFYPLYVANNAILHPLPVQYVQFDGAKAYRFIYGTTDERLGERLCELVRAGEIKAEAVLPVVATIVSADPETEMVTVEGFRDFIELHLNEVPREPFGELRVQIFGTDDVTATECAYRLNSALKSIYTPSERLAANNGTLEEFACLIRENGYYCDRLLTHDLASALRDLLNDEDNVHGNELVDGLLAAKDLSQFIRHLELSDVDISMIISMAVNRIYAGAAYEYAVKDPSAGARDMAQSLSRHTGSVADRVKSRRDLSIYCGLWHAMSPFAVEKSLDSDATKLVMYNLSRDRKYLQGIKDKSLLDTSFGADLGL